VTGLILPMELETRAQYWTECHGGFSKGFYRRRFDLTSKPVGPATLYPLAAGQFGSGAAMAFRAMHSRKSACLIQRWVPGQKREEAMISTALL
jgi:hypothetical protein